MKRGLVLTGLMCGLLILNQVQVQAETAEDLLKKGNVAYKTHEYKDAVGYYSKALQMKPDLDEALYQRGRSYARLKKFDEAIADLKKLTTKQKIADNALNQIGLIYAAKRDYKKAERYFKVANEIKKSPVYCLNAARAAFQGGNSEGAIRYCLDATKIDPKYNKARQFLKKIVETRRNVRERAEFKRTVREAEVFASESDWRRCEKLTRDLLARKSAIGRPNPWSRDQLAYMYFQIQKDIPCTELVKLSYLAAHNLPSAYYNSDLGSARASDDHLWVIAITLGGMYHKCKFEDLKLLEDISSRASDLDWYRKDASARMKLKYDKSAEKLEAKVKKLYWNLNMDQK
jgi:tetratricopeptide (TPR) repeat protein